MAPSRGRHLQRAICCLVVLSPLTRHCATDPRVRLIKSRTHKRCKASAASLVPVCDTFSFQNVSRLTFRYPPQCACRMLPLRVRPQSLAMKRQIQSPSQSSGTAISPLVAPKLIDPTTSAVADPQISRNNFQNELHSSLVARIAQLSNTMAQHGQHFPQCLYPNNPDILPPLPLRFNGGPPNPLTRTVLEDLLGGTPDPLDLLNITVCINPPATTTSIDVSLSLCRWTFITRLRGHPENLCAIWSNSLRM